MVALDATNSANPGVKQLRSLLTIARTEFLEVSKLILSFI